MAAPVEPGPAWRDSVPDGSRPVEWPTALQLCPGGSQGGPGQRVGLRPPTPRHPLCPPQEVLLGWASHRGEALSHPQATPQGTPPRDWASPQMGP